MMDNRLLFKQEELILAWIIHTVSIYNIKCVLDM